MPFNPILCAGCPLEGLHRPAESEGPEDARFVVVTDVPSRAAAAAGRLMANADKRIVAEAMVGQGFTREDFLFTPSVRCAYDPNDYTNKQQQEIQKHCRIHLLSEIEAAPREAIIPLGAKATTSVIGKPTKITKVRGSAQRTEGVDAPIFPLMSPVQVRNYPQNAPVFQADVEAFGRYREVGFDAEQAQSERTTGQYTRVKDLQFLLDQDPDAELILSFDTENTGLRWYQSGVDVRTYRPEHHRKSAVFKPRAQILTMQFSLREGESFVLVWDHPEDPIPEEDKPRLRNQLRKLLCHPNRIVTGFNTKYDQVYLWMTEGIRFSIGGDAHMMLALLDENMLEKNLDIATKLYVKDMAGYADHFNRTVDKSRMWEVPIADIIPYGGGDTDATLRLYNVLEPLVMNDKQLWAHYVHVSIPGLNAFSGLEAEGMYVDDRVALPAFRELMEREVEEARVSLLAELPRELKRSIVEEYRNRPDPKTGRLDKSRAKETPDKILSFTRPEFVRDILFTHKKGFRLKPKVFTKTTGKLNNVADRQPSTSAKDHLPYFFDECPFTERLATYQKDVRMLNTAIVRYEENYIRGGKVRPTYSLAKAVTGRTASVDPNGQNVPKRGARAKSYTAIFTPPPPGWDLKRTPYIYLADELPDEDDDEWVIVAADYSQAELRIAASYANENTMLAIYRSGGDIHTATAMLAMGVTQAQWDALPKEVRKAARQKAKAINFGFLYGMSYRKFVGYAKTQYGVDFTDDEAEQLRDKYFHKYAKLLAWHNSVRAFARRMKMVRSYTGRIRHLPMVDSPEEYIQGEALRQAINSPVQETGSSVGVMALARITNHVDPRFLRMVGFVHDSLVGYTRRKHLDWALRTLKSYMEMDSLGEWFGVKLKCPMVADPSFGLTISAAFECEGFDLDAPFDYDAVMRDKDGNKLPDYIDLPPQEVPPHNGLLQRSVFTLDTDLEPEDVAPAPRVHRIIRGVATEATIKRVARSSRQMVINKRLREAKQAEARYVRRVLRTNPAATSAKPKAAAPRRPLMRHNRTHHQEEPTT